MEVSSNHLPTEREDNYDHEIPDISSGHSKQPDPVAQTHNEDSHGSDQRQDPFPDVIITVGLRQKSGQNLQWPLILVFIRTLRPNKNFRAGNYVMR